MSAPLFPGTNRVDILPPEILAEVCSYLPVRERLRLRNVCKSFRLAVDSPRLWRRLRIDGFHSSDYARLGAMLADGRGSAVEEMYLSGTFNLVGLAKDLCTCTNLRSLTLSQSSCYVTNMVSIVRALPRLERLEFQPVNTACGLGHCTHVMCRAVEWQEFLAAVQHLNCLNLLTQWDENFIEFLVRQWACQQYRPLNIAVITTHTKTMGPVVESVQSYYSSLQDLWKECMESFPPCEDACQFQVTWQKSRVGVSDVPLFELNLDGSPLSLSTAISYTHPEAGDPANSMHGMITLSAREPLNTDHLSELCDEESDKDDERFLCGRFVSSPEFVLSEIETRFVSFKCATAHLTYLSLTEATALNSANLETIAVSCPQLTQLNLASCKKCLNPLIGLAALSSNCPRLRALNLQGIPCNYVERTSEMWLCLSQMPELRHLAIDPCLLQASQEADEFTGEQYSISDEHEIEQSLKNMTKIQVLEVQTALTQCKSIMCPHCRNMDGHLLGLVKHMTLLNTLHIRGVSPTVCGILLRAAIINCKYLRNLNVNMEFCFGLPLEVRNSGLEKLSICCPRFNVIDGVAEALSRAPLTHLYLAVRSVSRNSLETFLQDLPGLVVCHVYCRDGPVMKPPGEILCFRQAMLDMSSRPPHAHPLDFTFTEGRLYNSHTECSTTQSMITTELVSWWN